MLGSLNAAADLVQLGRLHMRPLQFHLLANWKPHRDSLVQPIPISHSCRVAIKWWMNPSIYVAGIPIVIPAPDFHLFSDDSHSGWGAHLEPLGLEVQGLWDVASQDLHINNLELRAVFLALQHFQSHIYNSCVMVASNNSSVVAYLKKQGGTHSPSLCMLVWELLYWCHHRNIHIQVRHIPGKLNVLADSLSRPDRILPTEWSLDREIATQIFSLWGTPQIDLFATRLNHLLPLFVSPVPDHRACAVDAMSLEWKNLFAYAFPPFKLVPLVLNKMRDSNSRFILIAPCWPQRSWFSVILSLIIDFPRELPVHRGLVSQHQGKLTPSESSYVASSHLEVVRSQIRGRHISEFATQCISQSRRESTLKVYSARWKMLSDWCLQREVNPVDPALKWFGRFFYCYLFNTLKLSVASIKGYRSAISNTLNFFKSADCTADPIISDLIKGFALRKPVSRSLTPKWNLTCVLWSLNKAPYEPLKTADIKYIMLIAVFLLTFAATRRSEIHALSIEEGCFRYDHNSDSITLLTQPGFLAKKKNKKKTTSRVITRTYCYSRSFSVLWFWYGC